MSGASPVLGHAATTRSFSVRDEIEMRDDLDKKPDDERSPVTSSVQIYLEDLEYFLSSLGRLRGKGKFDPAKDTFSVVQSTLLPCVDSNLAGRYTPIRFDSSSDASRPAMEYFSRGMVFGYSLGDCIANNEFTGVNAADSRFSFELDAKTFVVNVVVKKESPQRAIELARQLESTLKLYAARANTALRKKVIEYTRFRIDKDQVIVVTRLPRGSLSSLLAIDAK